METHNQREAYRQSMHGIKQQVQDAGGEWHDYPNQQAIVESTRFRAKPDGTEKPRFFANEVLGDGVSGVYLGTTIEETLHSLRNCFDGWTPEDLHSAGDDIVITLHLMTDAQVAALPEL